MTKPADIRAKSDDQLSTMLLDLRREQFKAWTDGVAAARGLHVGYASDLDEVLK